MTYFDYDIYVYDVEGFALSFSNKQCVFPFIAQTRSNQYSMTLQLQLLKMGLAQNLGSMDDRRPFTFSALRLGQL